MKLLRDNLTKFVIAINNSALFVSLRSTKLYKVLINFRSKIRSSLLFFSLFVLWGSFSMSENIEMFTVTASSFRFLSLFFILIRYLQTNVISERSVRNANRWIAYRQYVAEKYQIVYIYSIKRFTWIVMLPCSILVLVYEMNTVIPVLLILPWSFCQLIICYYALKTPFPESLRWLRPLAQTLH
jgi:hypothetical protein